MIKFIKGDCLSPIGNNKKLIIHVVNNLGGWGKGFVLSLSNKWKEPEEKYREWYKNKNNFKLGEIQRIDINEEISIINMLAQHAYRFKQSDPPAVNINNLEMCLLKVKEIAISENREIHAPRIGCGLAGLSWHEVEGILKNIFDEKINIYIYDLN